ncbi:MAG TPA: flagellar hook assembly protein FlgD [Bacillota bacterium]|nr:flagellar hook assembly protein FlgD [Bacillota bacterium]
MTKIDPSLYLSSQKTMREPSPVLDKDGFLKILMTQMQNQDPLNPMSDQDMVQQMATLTSVEQLINMSNSIETLVHSQLMSPVIQYSHMIGKMVTYLADGEEVTSKVVAVTQRDGWALLELENGETIYADAATKVIHADSNKEDE